MMISKDTIKNTLFFDIETTTRYKTYEEYLENEPHSAKDFENQIRMKKEYNGMDIADVYKNEAMLSPEHGQIVSIGCRIFNKEEMKWEEEIFGFQSWEEYEAQDKKNADRDILIRFNELLYGLFENTRGTLGGYNINKFDTPYLYRRMLANGLYPQKTLITVGIKPWDLNNLELRDWWSGTGANGYSGFSSACEMMGIGSSKEDGLDGRQVCYKFWDDHDVEAINQYCMRDVVKSSQLALTLSEDYLQKRHKATMEDYHRRMAEKTNQPSETNNTGE